VKCPDLPEAATGRCGDRQKRRQRSKVRGQSHLRYRSRQPRPNSATGVVV